MNLDFLPDGHETHVEGKKNNYLKIEEGTNTIRVMSNVLAGWEDWKDEKTSVRTKDKPKTSFNQAKKPYLFWVMYVWSYNLEDLFIWQVKQATIIAPLHNLATDPDYGDFRGYDIKVSRTGKDKNSKYTVYPGNKGEVARHIQNALDDRPVRLQSFLEGRNPFKDFDPLPASSSIFAFDSGELPFMNELQKAHLDNLLAGNDKMKEDIKKHFKIESVYQMPMEQYEKICNMIAARG